MHWLYFVRCAVLSLVILKQISPIISNVTMLLYEKVTFSCLFPDFWWTLWESITLWVIKNTSLDFNWINKHHKYGKYTNYVNIMKMKFQWAKTMSSKMKLLLLAWQDVRRGAEVALTLAGWTSGWHSSSRWMVVKLRWWYSMTTVQASACRLNYRNIIKNMFL